MALIRKGNKTRIAHKIYPFFPAHRVFVDLFFGAGGMYFSKPQAKYNFCNDADAEVYNFFTVLKNQQEAFFERFESVPLDEKLFKHWIKNTESDPVWKAIRFVYLSNFSLYGAKDCFKLQPNNQKDFMAIRFVYLSNFSLYGAKDCFKLQPNNQKDFIKRSVKPTNL